MLSIDPLLNPVNVPSCHQQSSLQVSHRAMWMTLIEPTAASSPSSSTWCAGWVTRLTVSHILTLLGTTACWYFGELQSYFGAYVAKRGLKGRRAVLSFNSFILFEVFAWDFISPVKSRYAVRQHRCSIPICPKDKSLERPLVRAH